MRVLRLWALAGLALVPTVPAHAGEVTESEANGAATNNTLATAEMIPAGAFAPNSDPNVFGAALTATVLGRGGANDVDFFSFQGPAGAAYFDIDGAAAGFDTYLALFSSAGTLLADSNDSFPPDPGSASDLDAFLGVFSLPSAGTYFIAVATGSNFANATFTGSDFFELMRPDGAFGGFAFGDATPGDSSFKLSGPQQGDAYTLHISVPAPGAGTTLAIGLVAAARRRRPGA